MKSKKEIFKKIKYMSGAICGVSRGRYVAPIPIREMKFNWEDDEGNPIDMPQKHPCEHDNHWEWGRSTRNGQKLYFPTAEMFWQKWHLTDKELREAVKHYDMFSLEMRGRMICEECAEKVKIKFANDN